jgi:hypothetical protein
MHVAWEHVYTVCTALLPPRAAAQYLGAERKVLSTLSAGKEVERHCFAYACKRPDSVACRCLDSCARNPVKNTPSGIAL